MTRAKGRSTTAGGERRKAVSAAELFRPEGDRRPSLEKLWRRMTGAGFIRREGTLKLERAKIAASRSGLPADVTGLGTTDSWYGVRFTETPEEVQGHVHGARVLNRVNSGDRVAIEVDPVDGFIRRIRPLDRKLRWWQI